MSRDGVNSPLSWSRTIILRVVSEERPLTTQEIFELVPEVSEFTVRRNLKLAVRDGYLKRKKAAPAKRKKGVAGKPGRPPYVYSKGKNTL